MSKDSNYYCHSLRLAGFLMLRGFILFELRDDDNSKRKIYIFRNSSELSQAVKDYKSSK